MRGTAGLEEEVLELLDSATMRIIESVVTRRCRLTSSSRTRHRAIAKGQRLVRM